MVAVLINNGAFLSRVVVALQFQPPPEEPQQPINPMCFPPGILSSLLQKRDERPYEPLELDEIQREGLPEPNEPDAFLRSRIDKFYAEVRSVGKWSDLMLAPWGLIDVLLPKP